MVDTVSKPYLLKISLQRLPLLALAATLVVNVDSLQGATHSEVVLEVLVEHNITTTLRSLREVVNQNLLLQGQLLEARHFITDNFDIIKAIHNPRFLLYFFAARRENSGKNSHNCYTKNSFHHLFS